MTQNPASAAGTGDGFADFLLGYPANSTLESGDLVGRVWHVCARVLPGRLQGRELADPEPGYALQYTPWLTGYKGQAAAFDPTREKSIIVSSKTSDIDLSVQRLADVGYTVLGSHPDQQPGWCR